jgi:hypothetical protein
VSWEGELGRGVDGDGDKWIELCNDGTRGLDSRQNLEYVLIMTVCFFHHGAIKSW